MAEIDILPASLPPVLDPQVSQDDHVDLMVEWFHANFEDPANSLPYESKEGGYQWLWGGPFDATEQLYDAFPDATESEIAAAVGRIEHYGVVEWSVSGDRVVAGRDRDVPPEVRFGERTAPPIDHQRAFSIVETVLYPRVTWQFAVRATFVPGNTNAPLGSELDEEPDYLTDESGEPLEDSFGQRIEIGDRASALIKRDFTSLRALVAGLINLELDRADGGAAALIAARNWIESLDRDSDLFVDDAIIVHSSPPAWVPLSKLFGKGVDAGSVSAIVLTVDGPGQMVGYLLAYGGARIVLRFVHGVNFVQDAWFERLGERVRRGEFDSGEREQSKQP